MKFAALVRTLNIHGGVRRYFELGNALVDAGHSFTLFGATTKEQGPWMTFRGRLRPFGHWGSESFDVAITGDNNAFADFLSVRAKRRVVLVVAKFYADAYLDLWRRYGRQLLWVGVASDWNLGMEEIEGVTIQGGVDTGFFSPPNNSAVPTTPEPGPLSVAFYARLGNGRGVERVLATLGECGDTVRPIGFDAPGYPTLQSSRKVPVTTCPTQESMRDVLRGADVLLSAMHWAGWNNCVAEAMACGCVPIATLAGTRDLILPGVTGFLCEEQEFVDRAVSWIRTLAEDPELRVRVGRSAAAWVQQFSWRQVAARLLAELERRDVPCEAPSTEAQAA